MGVAGQIGRWVKRRRLGRPLADADLAEADRLADALDYAGALRLLDRHTPDRQRRRRADRRRVVLLERIGDLPAALAAARIRLDETPDDANARADVERLAAANGDRTAPAYPLPANPTRADAALFRHRAHRAMADARYPDALALSRTAFDLTGRAGDGGHHLAMLFIAGHVAQGEAFASELAARFPDDPRFPVRLAQHAERRRDWAGMLALHERALACDPAARASLAGKARARIYLGQDAGGVLPPGLPNEVMAAFAAARAGDPAAARAALDRGYALGGGHLAADAAARGQGLTWLGEEAVRHPSRFAAANDTHFARFLSDLDAAGEVILIGNSPALIGRGLGAEIDRADVIIRLNDFETAGFEADVGSRTDWWLSSAAFQARPNAAGVAGASALLVQPYARHFPDPAAFMRGRLGLDPGPRRVGYLPPWLHEQSAALPYPMATMGFRTIMMLEFLIQRPFRAIGFDFFATTQMHYFDAGETRLRVSEVHAIDFERDFVAQVLAPFGRYGRFG